MLGASIIEKHFTDTFKRVGPDISCSVDEKGLSELIKASKILFKQRFGQKNYLSQEQVTRNFAYASVVSKKNIKKNEKLSRENITVKRPGTGQFPANSLKKLFGKKAKKSIKENIQIKKIIYLGNLLNILFKFLYGILIGMPNSMPPALKLSFSIYGVLFTK